MHLSKITSMVASPHTSPPSSPPSPSPSPSKSPSQSPPQWRPPRTSPPNSPGGSAQGSSELQAPIVLRLLPASIPNLRLTASAKECRWPPSPTQVRILSKVLIYKGGFPNRGWGTEWKCEKYYIFLFVVGSLHKEWTELGGEQHTVPLGGWLCIMMSCILNVWMCKCRSSPCLSCFGFGWWKLSCSIFWASTWIRSNCMTQFLPYEHSPMTTAIFDGDRHLWMTLLDAISSLINSQLYNFTTGSAKTYINR